MVLKRKKTEAYISHCYSTWGKSYYGDYYGKNSNYPPVHKWLIQKLIKSHKARTLLDAGCGPASILRDIIKQKITAYGFDLTPEMVEEAKRVFKKQGLPPSRIWEGSVLDKKSFSPPGSKNIKFDASICIGVLPHIPHKNISTVFKNLKDAVKKNGLVVVEARNQFFALYTLNRYSYDFFKDELLRVNDLTRWVGKNKKDLSKALNLLQKQFRMDLPARRKGKKGEPGYDEVLSLTHNPFLLKEEFAKVGFKNVRLLFYHYHCLPPLVSHPVRELFLKESVAMEDPYDWRGYFMASAFLLAGEKI